MPKYVVSRLRRASVPHFTACRAVVQAKFDCNWNKFPNADITEPAALLYASYRPSLNLRAGSVYNSAAGSVMSAFGNLFQLQSNFAWTTARHAVKWGTEARLNRDTTYFGISPNGEYDFGGGTVYSPVFIPSASGRPDLHPAQPLPH